MREAIITRTTLISLDIAAHDFGRVACGFGYVFGREWFVVPDLVGLAHGEGGRAFWTGGEFRG